MLNKSQNNNISGKVSSDDSLIKDFVETNQQIFLSAEQMWIKKGMYVVKSKIWLGSQTQLYKWSAEFLIWKMQKNLILKKIWF